MNSFTCIIGAKNPALRKHVEGLTDASAEVALSDEIWAAGRDQAHGEMSVAEAVDWTCLVYGHLFSVDGPLDIDAIPAQVLGQIIARNGVDGLNKTDGRYIVVFRDAKNGKVTVSGDPVGLMSVFYSKIGGGVAVATDINSLLALPGMSQEPDPSAIAGFLTCSRYNLLVDKTFYRDIAKIPANHAMLLAGDDLKLLRFWLPDISQDNPVQGSDEEIVETARQMMLDATQARTAGEGQMAAALSGGFDSSSVVSMMRYLDESKSRPFTTISFNFGSDEADEDDLIDAVSEMHNTEHHRLNVLEKPFFTEMDAIIEANAGPVLESGVLLLWKKKAELARLGMSASLSGLGGDELFMGRMNFLADEVSQFHFKTAWREIRAVYPFDGSTGKKTSLKKLLKANVLSPLEPYALKNYRQAGPGKKYPPAWVQGDLVKRGLLDGNLPRAAPPRASTVYQQDCWEVFYYELLNGGITYHSIAGDATGIDTRFPLLDRKLIEYMFRVPRRLKISNGKVRHVQQEAMRPFLPPELLRDHLKKDFHPVLDAHLRREYTAMLEPLFAAKSHLSDDFVDWDALRDPYQAFLDGKAKPYSLWVALCLERWLELKT